MRNIPHRVLICVSVFAFMLSLVLLATAQEPTTKTGGPSFMTSLEAAVIDEINLARANPGQYASYLEETRKYYNGKSYLPPSRKKPITTFDGIAALDEAISFLKSSGPLGPLQPSAGLSCGARDHSQDMVLKGTSGHRGSDGSLPNDRISRYGTWKSTVGEAILYRVSTAREMVLELIVDDGNPGRPHRKNVFEPSFQVAGVSISPESARGTFCVIDYAGGFAEKGEMKAAATAPAVAEAKAVAPATTTAETKTVKTPATTKTKSRSSKRG
jgi:uncharacterized protein YkwD